MDIIKKIRPLKATYLSLSLKHKFGIIITLISLTTVLAPHKTFAYEIKQADGPPMIFEIGAGQDYLANLNLQLNKIYEHEKMQRDLNRQIMLGEKVKAYLRSQGSPLAD